MTRRTAGTLEARLEAMLYKGVTGPLHGLAVKIAPTVVGVPDRLVLLPGGRMYLIELKTSVGNLSPAQLAWHEEARERGVTVTTLYGEGQVKAWLAARSDERADQLRRLSARRAAAARTRK